jgi:hypothetical protein
MSKPEFFTSLFDIGHSVFDIKIDLNPLNSEIAVKEGKRFLYHAWQEYFWRY